MPPEDNLIHFDYYRQAKTYEANGQLDEALKAYSRAIEVSADYAHAWFYKAQLLYRMEKYKDCIKCAERALALQPSWREHIAKLVNKARSKA